jgi:hypothetical protein
MVVVSGVNNTKVTAVAHEISQVLLRVDDSVLRW